MSEPIRFLAAADLHAGRPVALPPGVPGECCALTRTLSTLVRAAIQHRVSAVLLAGDVFDKRNAYFESFGPLESAVRELAAAGIKVIAVAGNHDHDALPRLAEASDGNLILLGQGGQWSEHVLQIDGKDAVRFIGWSFPQSHIADDPTDRLSLSASNVPTIGLLHGDLDAAASTFAPFRRAALERHADTWILGHIHKPTHGEHGVFYTGSVQGLDVAEHGPRGAWLLTLSPGQAVRRTFLPLAGLRFEQLSLDASSLTVEDDLLTQLPQLLREAVSKLGPLSPCECVVARVKLIGRCTLHATLPDVLSRLDVQSLTARVEDVPVHLESIQLHTQPKHDPAALKHDTTLAGDLSNLIETLRQSPDHADDLLAAATRRMTAFSEARVFERLEPTEADTRDALLQAATRAFDLMMDTRQSQEASA